MTEQGISDQGTSEPGYFAHESAVVDEGAQIGSGTRIWHFTHVFSGAVIGERCSLGQNVMVANGVHLGANVKVQNNVSIFEGTTVEDDVFLGPSCVLTNVSNPRSQITRKQLYESTLLRRGATVGANATIVCGVELGRYCFIAAGAVVTKNVPDYALIRGVPGRQAGWMSRHGHVLRFDESRVATCPESGLRYQVSGDDEGPRVRCLDLDEETPLPERFATGSHSYRQFTSKQDRGN